MMQHLQAVVDRDATPPLAVEEVSDTSADLNILLLRCSELSRDVARMCHLLEDLSRQVVSHRLKGSIRSKHPPRQLTRSSAHHWEPIAKGNSPSAANGENTRTTRSKLERACLIALMETNDPISVETIYDRIERRGSFTFAGYKHPFRAVVLAMGALVRNGEACLLNEQGRRRWRREPERTPVEQPPASTLS